MPDCRYSDDSANGSAYIEALWHPATAVVGGGNDRSAIATRLDSIGDHSSTATSMKSVT